MLFIVFIASCYDGDIYCAGTFERIRLGVIDTPNYVPTLRLHLLHGTN